MSRSRTESEAMRWVIQIQTSRSIEPLWPQFETWLLGDRRNWTAFTEAQQAWSRWDRLSALLRKDHRAMSKQLCALDTHIRVTRARKDALRLALGIALLALLLVWTT